MVAGATDKDIEALVQAFEGSEQIKVQIAKYINNVNQAQDSQFGDRFTAAWSAERVDQDVDVEASQRETLKQNQLSVNELVQLVRLRFHDNIQRLHDTMPLLGIDLPGPFLR